MPTTQLRTGDGLEEADFEAHLEYLSDAGAVFSFSKALAESFVLKQGLE